MRMDNLHLLPKVRDRISYLYVEHARVDQEAKAIAVHDAEGATAVPCAGLGLLLLGPGTRITQAAMLALADNGCTVVWCGEAGVRFYAGGTGATRHAARLLHQAALCSRKSTRLKVVRRMYALRFGERLDPVLTLQQIRGREGVRVRDAYARMSLETGVPWRGRSYKRDKWSSADPVNRALSTANACLYGVCHAAIVAAGYSPALGFIHTGKQLSFVYDVADFYKVDVTVPAAFHTVAQGTDKLERRVRHACRDFFAGTRLLENVVKDIDTVLQIAPEPDDLPEDLDFDGDAARPGDLWDPDVGHVAGGIRYTPPDEEDKPAQPTPPPGLADDDAPWPQTDPQPEPGAAPDPPAKEEEGEEWLF